MFFHLICGCSLKVSALFQAPVSSALSFECLPVACLLASFSFDLSVLTQSSATLAHASLRLIGILSPLLGSLSHAVFIPGSSSPSPVGSALRASQFCINKPYNGEECHKLIWILIPCGNKHIKIWCDVANGILCSVIFMLCFSNSIQISSIDKI